MAYIGKQPTVGNFVKLDAITTSATTTFNLTNGGVAYYPQSANHCLVSLNGILQAPTDSFTISGSTIIFSSALTTSDVIDFIIVLGDVLNIGTPSDNTVSLAKLTATGTKDSTTFLRGDNTFATVTSGLTEADQWRLTTAFTTTGDNDITSNLERVDTTTGQTGLPLGTGMTQSSGVFTFPSTGYYLIAWNASIYNGGTDNYIGLTLRFSTDSGSTYTDIGDARGSVGGNYDCISGIAILDITSTSTNKIKFQALNIGAGSQLDGSTTNNLTYFTFTKLGNT